MAIAQTRTIDTSELFEGPRQTRRPNVRGRRGAIYLCASSGSNDTRVLVARDARRDRRP